MILFIETNNMDKYSDVLFYRRGRPKMSAGIYILLQAVVISSGMGNGNGFDV